MTQEKMLTVRVGENVKNRLDEMCEDNGLKMRWVVEQAIIMYCDAHDERQRLLSEVEEKL